MSGHQKGTVRKVLDFKFAGYHIEDWVGMLLLVLLVLVVLYQVSMRVFSSAPPLWTEEFARNLLIILTFMGASIAVRNSSNISLDFILQGLPEKYSRVVNIIARGLEIIFYAVCSYLSIQMSFFSTGRYLVSIRIPRTIIYGFVAFGFIMMTFRALLRAYDIIRGYDRREGAEHVS